LLSIIVIVNVLSEGLVQSKLIWFEVSWLNGVEVAAVAAEGILHYQSGVVEILHVLLSADLRLLEVDLKRHITEDGVVGRI
jgi:hypothetical protein